MSPIWAASIANWATILSLHFMLSVGWLWSILLGVCAATAVFLSMGGDFRNPLGT